MSKKHVKIVLPALLAFAGVAPGVALAQSSDTDDEIVVTATRREEKVQDVPIAVTALTAEMLATQGVDSVRDLANVAPSLTMRTFPGDNTSATINLRGLFTADNLISIDPAVGMYLDGVYIGRSTGGNLGMLDIARVEVLRGPQGTLFGRNTIGGAISLVTQSPTDELEGHIAGGAGNFGLWNVEGVVNIPMTEQAALRLAASHSEHDGYAQSSLTGRELNADNSDFVRGQFRLDASEDLQIVIGGDYWHTSNEGQWVTLGAVVPNGRLALERDLANGLPLNGTPTLTVDPYTRNPPSTTVGPGFTAQVWGVNGTVTWDAPIGTFKSITAYREIYRDNQGNDLDGSPAVGIQQFQDYTEQSQTSQELQYLGEAMNGRLDWIVGAYYFREDGLNRSRSSFVPLLTDCLGPPTAGVCDGIPSAHSITHGVGVNRSNSVFAQIGFDLTDTLKFNAGARRVDDEREVVLFSRNVLASATPLEGDNPATILSCATSGATPATLCRFVTPKGEFDYTPFMVGLDWRAAEDVLFYGKYSRGFRAGGVNIRGTFSGALQPFGPEQADTIELGMKADFFDRMLRINAAVYTTDYQDIQLSSIIQGPGNIPTATTQNAGEAEINGQELEATLRVSDFRFNLTASHVDPEYTRVAPNVTGVTLASGFQLTPEWQYSVGADYNVQFGENELRLHAGYDWQDDVFFASVPPNDPRNMQKAYGLVNARAALDFDRFEIAVWGQNLADEEYIITTTDLIGGGLGFLPFYPGDPRTYGVNVKVNF